MARIQNSIPLIPLRRDVPLTIYRVSHTGVLYADGLKYPKSAYNETYALFNSIIVNCTDRIKEG